MGDLRWAVMGTGLIAHKVLPRIAAVPGCAVAGVASRERSRAAAFASELALSGASAYTYEDLLVADDVDAVYVAVPNHLHTDWSIRLLKAGKHVLCEKPLTAVASEALSVFETAERAERVFCEGFMYMHHPQTRRLVEIAQMGDHPNSPIGPLRMIRAYFCFGLSHRANAYTRFSHAMQGGAVMDLGCYCAGFARLATGEEPVTVAAAATLTSPDEQGGFVDSTTLFAMRFGSGVLLDGACSLDTNAGVAVELIGEWGRVSTSRPWAPDPDEAILKIYRNERHPLGAGDGTETIENGGDMFSNQFADFAKVVAGEAELMPSRPWTVGQAETIERIHRELGVSFD